MHGAWLGNGYGVTALSLPLQARACASHSLTCACDRDANGLGHGTQEGHIPPVKRHDFDRTRDTRAKIIFSLLANGNERI